MVGMGQHLDSRARAYGQSDHTGGALQINGRMLTGFNITARKSGCRTRLAPHKSYPRHRVLRGGQTSTSRQGR